MQNDQQKCIHGTKGLQNPKVAKGMFKIAKQQKGELVGRFSLRNKPKNKSRLAKRVSKGLLKVKIN